MRFRSPRWFVAVAWLLVLPLLALATGPFASHGDHACSFDKECLTCRSAAHVVADDTASGALSRPLDAPEPLAAAPAAAIPDGVAATPSSRGPPLS